ncbi:MAG: hypothetical protein AAF289_16855 [Cyanobacteria bacterium P01_A01_bin.135]
MGLQKPVLSTLSAIALATIAVPAIVLEASAQLTAPYVSGAGTLDRNQDHFVDIEAAGGPLERVKVVCVTFHQLEDVKVVDGDGNDIPHTVNYGFEEFTVTFDEPIPEGEKARFVLVDSRVRGRRTGLTIPYRIFGTTPMLEGLIPFGTAIVTVPEVTGR